METKVKNREWVKDAAIAFLAVLLVLTFFSNTMMNRTLPEVASAEVKSGSIVAKVRGTGTVTASGTSKVKARDNRTIRAVMVKAGQEVEAGDVLFVLGEADETELERAMETLRDLQDSYRRSAISAPVYNYDSYERAIRNAETDYQRRLEELDVAAQKLAALDSPAVKAAEARYADAEARLQKMEEDYNEARIPLADAVANALERYNAAAAEEANCRARLDALIAEGKGPGDPEYDEAESALEQAEGDKLEAESRLNEAQSALDDFNDKEYTAVSEARSTRDLYLSEYTALVGTAAQDYQAALYAVEDAESAIQAAYDALNEARQQDARSAESTSIELQSIAEQITRQQEKIRKLAGEDENVITAPTAGTVSSIEITAGEMALKDSVVATIEVPDMGHTLSFSVTEEQARRLRVGDTATISNYYWGNSITATLSSIRTDPKSPQNGRILTFDLEGDVTSGSELTISVGSKSANYDLVVPNAAIKSDTNGKFVLVIAAKNSPLGNRYTARRVSVEVLASDDNNSAVVADVSAGDFVITTSSAPIKSGDMVRIANE